MSYEIYQYISIGSIIMCGVMLVVSCILFFFLKIPKSMGLLTGVTAKKAIKSINERSEQSTSQRLENNLKKKGVNGMFSPSGRIQMKTNVKIEENAPVTGKITVAPHQSVETVVLEKYEDNNSTMVLDSSSVTNQTTVLTNSPVETKSSLNQTTVLSENCPSQFVVEVDITFIHTDEIIL